MKNMKKDATNKYTINWYFFSIFTFLSLRNDIYYTVNFGFMFIIAYCLLKIYVPMQFYWSHIEMLKVKLEGLSLNGETNVY